MNSTSNFSTLRIETDTQVCHLTSQHDRPWGTFTVIDEGPEYEIKRIVVKPGHSQSLQLHHHRSEHWVVVAGVAKVTCGNQEIFLSANQSTYIPRHTIHRLENPGIIPLILIEVQNGEYLGEDDIIRFEDNV